MVISQEIPQTSITKITWKFTNLKLNPNLPGFNELKFRLLDKPAYLWVFHNLTHWGFEKKGQHYANILKCRLLIDNYILIQISMHFVPENLIHKKSALVHANFHFIFKYDLNVSACLL